MFKHKAELIKDEIVTILCVFCLQQELSQHLQSLSERARAGTEFMQQLKVMADKIQVSLA